jgi:hypothetical protein
VLLDDAALADFHRLAPVRDRLEAVPSERERETGQLSMYGEVKGRGRCNGKISYGYTANAKVGTYSEVRGWYVLYIYGFPKQTNKNGKRFEYPNKSLSFSRP